MTRIEISITAMDVVFVEWEAGVDFSTVRCAICVYQCSYRSMVIG